jgi:hypothetical protein
MNLRKNSLPLTFCTLCLLPGVAAAQSNPTVAQPTNPTVAPNPALTELAARLKPVILAAHPDATVKVEGNWLVARYHVQKFLSVAPMPSKPLGPAPGQNYQLQTIEDDGPLDDGYLLEIDIRSLETTPVLIPTPLTVRWPLWSTYFKRYASVPPTTPAKGTAIAQVLRLPQTLDYVSNEHDYWAYAAIKTLASAGWLKGYSYEFDSDRPATRYDFAVAILHMLRNVPLVEKNRFVFTPGQPVGEPPLLGDPGPRFISGEPGIAGPPLPGDPPTKAQLMDAILALTREFRDEIAQLDARGRQAVFAAQTQPGSGQQPYLWLSLSYGTKADAKLIELIKTAVAAYASQKATLSR